MRDHVCTFFHSRRWWVYTLLAVLFVFAMRVHWIDGSVSRLPYWDELPAELVTEAKRAPGESPGIRELASPHNEHRILWQRLLGRALLHANDRVWDTRVRCMANALIAALYAGLLANAFRAGQDGRTGHFLFWPTIVLVASPIAYQNITFGFQASFHLQMLFSIMAFVGMAGSSWRRPLWWLGLICAFAAIFTNGSGFFTGPVLLVWCALALARREDGKWFSDVRGNLRRQLPTIIASLLVLAVGLALIYRPEHAAGQEASGIGEFFHGLGKHLAWPWQNQPWLGPLIWVPFFVLSLLTLFGRMNGNFFAASRFTACMGGWILLQLLAMAYVRGANAVGPVSRYEDFHLLGIATNIAALVLVVTSLSASPRRIVSFLLPTGAILWGATTLSGLFVLASWAWRFELPDYRAFGELRERNTARFTRDGDATVFDGYVSRFHLPYDELEALKSWLADPAVVAVLPGSFHTSPEAVENATRTGACLDSKLPDGMVVPPGERLLASSFDRSDGPAGKDAQVMSGPIQAQSGAFRLFYLGMDTGGSLKLRLRPEGKGKPIEIPTMRRHGTSTWMPITVDVDPEKTYRLEFRDASRLGWGAVTLPTNEPPLSRLADQAGKFALPVGVFSMLLILSFAIANAPAHLPSHPLQISRPREREFK
ncbi:MAG: hypothetical protein ACKO2G_12330 [Verrucomicrobiales bacterium]